VQTLTTDLDGPLTYADHGGPADGPALVLVHGLGASHLSWLSLAERLVATHRVLAVDLVGFGHSEPLTRRSAVEGNRDVLARFVRQVVRGPATLVGNSMGGMVAALTAHAHPAIVEALVLVNPALPGTLHPRALRTVDPRLAMHFALYNLPGVGARAMRLRRQRLTPRQQVTELLAGVCADPGRIDPRLVDLLVSLAESRRAYPWSDEAFLEAQRSVMRHLTTGRKRYLELLSGLRQPILLVHGDQDRLIDVGAARALAPRNPAIQLVVLPGVGHAPQLEAPDALAAAILGWHAGALDQAA
jgi:pimeloyl-ACP methyl ester carboxylesterase